MYASNLQELLFNCFAHSDMSPQTFPEFKERFDALRSWGHLPQGLDHHRHLLSPLQIAAAVLGLAPTRPSWAGHGASVLKTLSPVGGLQGSFHNTGSLIDAISLLLTDADARKSLIAVRLILGETVVNSNGGAVFAYESEGARKVAFYMPGTNFSITDEGVDSSFDIERELFSLASREMKFGRRFFERIAREMEIAAHHPGEPTSDGSEYDKEEAKQALWTKLGVTPYSRFLNMAADNHVTWPSEPTLVKFDSHHFVLLHIVVHGRLTAHGG